MHAPQTHTRSGAATHNGTIHTKFSPAPCFKVAIEDTFLFCASVMCGHNLEGGGLSCGSDASLSMELDEDPFSEPFRLSAAPLMKLTTTVMSSICTCQR